MMACYDYLIMFNPNGIKLKVARGDFNIILLGLRIFKLFPVFVS